jgi:hypothetical protein
MSRGIASIVTAAAHSPMTVPAQRHLQSEIARDRLMHCPSGVIETDVVIGSQ